METAAKYDTGKARYDLIPPEALEELVAVYSFGAAKYEQDQWRKGMEWRRVFAAIMRHTWAWMRGEDRDSESGLPHLAHAAWGCFTLMSYAKTGAGQDDRPRLDKVPQEAKNKHVPFPVEELKLSDITLDGPYAAARAALHGEPRA